MNTPSVVIGLVAAFLLTACGDAGNEPKQESATDAADESVFDGYVNDVKKAKQVTDTLQAEQQKLKDRIDGIGSGDPEN